MAVSDRLRAAIYVAVFSTAVRLIWASFAHATPISDFATYDQWAWRWVTTGEFMPGTAFLSPGRFVYPALVYSAFGHSPKAVAFVNGVLGGLTSGLLVLLAAQMVSVRGAVVAGLLHALSPTTIAYVALVASETPAQFLLVAGLLALRTAQQRRGWRRLGLAAAAGIMACALLYTRSAALFIAPAVVGLAVYDAVQRRWTWGTAAAFVVAGLLAFSPWAVRNVRMGLSPAALSTQGGWALWWDIHHYEYPDDRSRKPRHIRELPEVEQDRALKEAALNWIRDNPVLYLRLCLTRAIRVLGTTADPWAARYLAPTRANDRAVVAAYEVRHGGEADPELVETGRRLADRNYRILQWYRILIAPLALLALLAATARWRRFSLIVFPTWCYVGGVALTVFIERYREMSDILLFVPLGGLIADVLFRTTDHGVWPSRAVKRVTAFAAIVATVLLHVFGIAQPWHRLPVVEAPAPDVSGMTFLPVTFAEPTDTYVSCWSYSATEPLVTRQADALICSFPGGGKASGVQYGGIRFPVMQPEAIRLELSFQQPEAIEGVFVDGYDVAGNRRLRWQWLSSSRTPLPDGRRRYTFVPGRSVAFFRPKGPAQAADVVEIHVLVRAPVDSSAGFILHSAEVAPPEGLWPVDFTPATFDGAVAQYASPWGRSLPSRAGNRTAIVNSRSGAARLGIGRACRGRSPRPGAASYGSRRCSRGGAGRSSGQVATPARSGQPSRQRLPARTRRAASLLLGGPGPWAQSGPAGG
jgi:4-amino-4-deoxy-L-arabinose transferase-like glycosyltransferase